MGTGPRSIRLIAALLSSVAVMAWPSAGGAQRSAPSSDAQLGTPASERDEAIHLLRRATFGVRPGDVERVLSMGRDAWLERQLSAGRIGDAGLASRLAWFPAASASVEELVRDYTPPRPPPGDTVRPDPQQMTPEQRLMRAQMSPQRILADLVGAKLVRSAWSERQLEEVMTDFWFNHFNVFFGKGLDRYLVGDYERTAIRPHVFGRFEDMLLATAQHPAMLFYLDNWTSAAPDSAAAGARAAAQRERLQRLRAMTPRQRQQLIRSGRITPQQLEQIEAMADEPVPQGRRARGINENYARELLELHTLGVDGGYTQDDVVAVARALTGWTFIPPGERRGNRPLVRRQPLAEPGRFLFSPPLHDTTEKVVLGHVLPAGRGLEDGVDVIHILATHPSTARFIAAKLVERFVSDVPDPAFVEELATVFERSDGDLREVTRALFTSPRFYETSNIGSKVKSPFELVASAMRVTGAEIGPSRRLLDVLRRLGQLPYGESAPTGYPAVSADWVNGGAMLNRMNFGLELAAGRIDGVSIDGSRLLRLGRDDPDAAVPRILDALLPGMSTDDLESAIRADTEEQSERGAVTARMLGARVVGLALGSPEFQRR